MSTETVASRLGAKPDVAKALEDTCILFGISSVFQRSHFLGQMAQESQNYSRVVENMRYSAQRMAEVWPGRYAVNPQAIKKEPNERAIALARAGDKAIANDTYGGRMGNYLPNDGWDFRGQGYKMITGRDNFTRYSIDTYGDLRVLEDPSMLQRLPDSVLAGGWYWSVNNIGPHADRDDHLAVGRIINIGRLNTIALPIGHAMRVRKTEEAKKYFEELLHG